MDTKQNRNAPPRVWTKIGLSSDLDYFLENISMLIGSGMSIVDAFSSVQNELSTGRMRRVVKWMAEEVQAGSSFSDALERTGLFSTHTVTLIRIGERSGKLSANLKLVSEQQKKERIFRSRIKSALMYPVFVLSLTLIVGIGIAWFILPKLANVFAQLRIDLPALTKALIATGEFLSEYGIIVIPVVLVGFFILLFIVFSLPQTKFIGQTILFHTPGVSKLIRQVEIARFSYLLGTLLEAGLPIVRTIESLAEAASYPQYRAFYAFMARSIEDGNSFKKSIDAYEDIDDLFPAPVQQMIVAGEQSGNLPRSLSDISATYEERVETTTKNLTVILEPVLLVIVWIGVVAVALAVILPIYDLTGGLNTNPTPAAQERSAPSAGSDESVNTESATGTENMETEQSTTTTATTTPEANRQTLEILETGFGFLNVRDAPSTEEGVVIGRASPGDTYVYTQTQQGWFRIELTPESHGWVYGEYVEIK